MSAWIKHVKQYANAHNMKYSEALQSPKCRDSYVRSSHTISRPKSVEVESGNKHKVSPPTPAPIPAPIPAPNQQHNWGDDENMNEGGKMTRHLYKGGIRYRAGLGPSRGGGGNSMSTLRRVRRIITGEPSDRIIAHNLINYNVGNPNVTINEDPETQLKQEMLQSCRDIIIESLDFSMWIRFLKELLNMHPFVEINGNLTNGEHINENNYHDYENIVIENPAIDRNILFRAYEQYFDAHVH
jgi:hypothetical protein